MWAVSKHKKTFPIDYDKGLEYLYDGMSKVYFVKELMTPHIESCPYKNQLKQIY